MELKGGEVGRRCDVQGLSPDTIHGEVNRDLDSLSRAAAVARTGAMDASARTLRSYLVEAVTLGDASADAKRLAEQGSRMTFSFAFEFALD